MQTIENKIQKKINYFQIYIKKLLLLLVPNVCETQFHSLNSTSFILI